MSFYDGVVVHVHSPAELPMALKKFKKRVDVAGPMGELRRRESFMSPGKKRRWRRARAQARVRKAAKQMAVAM